MVWQRRIGPTALLGAAVAAAAALLLSLGWHYTFFQDTWAFLLDRQGSSLHDFLVPHNEHLVVLPVAIEKLLVAVFGMTTALPEFFVMTAVLLAAGVLLFIFVRRRTGPWPALLAAVLLLFLGSAWPVLLWPFEISLAGSTMVGIAMLVMLDRDDAVGDAWACVFLAVSIGFGSVGLSFAAAGLVDVFLKRRARGLRRAYVVLVPVALYLVWYAGWGRDAAHHLTLHNVLASPAYAFDGFASVVGSLAGLSTMSVTNLGQPEWGRPLLVALIALAIYGQRRRPGIPPGFWTVAAAGVSYWLLAAFNYIPGREAASSRYVYAGAVFLLLMAAELLRGVRFSRRALWIGAALVFVAILPNLGQMQNGAAWLEEQSVLTRADTGALDIARRTVAPNFVLNPEISGTGSLFIVEAQKYFEATAAHGSPGYSPAELEAAPEVGRHWADVVLANALGLSTNTTVETYEKGGAAKGCVSVQPGQEPAGGVRLSPGINRIEVAPGPQASFALRRFAATEFPVNTSGAEGESTTTLRIPPDLAPQPWYLNVEAQQEFRVCS
jgi:hypothetical protein